jgi:GNAT superfamily N-acetyltransferase
MRFSVSPRLAAEVEQAAQLWALATSARELEPEVPGLERSRPLIEDALSSPRSLLLLGRGEQDRTLAFAAAQPLVGEEQDTANVRYVAVHPEVWGRGVGLALMTALLPELLALGYGGGRLWAYADNSRAIALYESAGWRRSGPPDVHPRTGRLRCHFRIAL